MPLYLLTAQALDKGNQVRPRLLLELVLGRAQDLLEDLHQLRRQLLHELLDRAVLNLVCGTC